MDRTPAATRWTYVIRHGNLAAQSFRFEPQQCQQAPASRHTQRTASRHGKARSADPNIYMCIYVMQEDKENEQPAHSTSGTPQNPGKKLLLTLATTWLLLVPLGSARPDMRQLWPLLGSTGK
jgi:hypothetical protein